MGDALEFKPGVMVDPPSGWRYGFPKKWEPVAAESFNDWLVANGYPAELLPLAERATRYWNADEK